MSIGAAVSRMAVPALQRAGSMIFQKLLRLYRIDQALKGINVQTIKDSIIDDYAIINGSWIGGLTEDIDNFIKEIENSGLATALMTEALLNQTSDQTSNLFIKLCMDRTVLGQEESKNFLNEIRTSFRVSVEQISKDPALFAIIRSAFQELRLSILAVDDSVKSLESPIYQRISAEEESNILAKIARSLSAKYKSIRIETNQGPKDVDIKKIYIPPKLNINLPSARQASLDAVVEEIGKLRGRDHGIRIDHTGSLVEPIRARSERFSYQEIKSGFRRVVILGDPGGGKSTLCQSICYDLAQQIMHNHRASSPYPFRIILRDFERVRNNNAQLTLFDFLVNDILNSIATEREVIASCLKKLLETGRAVIAFDGLDEILRTALRRQFVDLVVEFGVQFPLCPILVTSRVVGYSKAPLPSEFDTLVLGKFEDTDVSEYATKFMKVVAGKKLPEARSLARKFMAQTETNAQDLRKNPLMLGLMMWIFNIRRDVPSNRPEIYQECSRLMFERWDTDRDILVDIPRTFDRFQVFSYLASKIFGDEDLAGGVTLDWIEKESRSYLSEVLENKPQAYQTAKLLIEFISGRAWVMSEKGEEVFSFTHQTFLEFFFAKFLDESHDTVSSILSRKLINRDHLSLHALICCRLSVRRKLSQRTQPKVALKR